LLIISFKNIWTWPVWSIYSEDYWYNNNSGKQSESR